MNFEVIGTGGNCQAYLVQYKRFEVLITHEYGPDLPIDKQPYRISLYPRNKALADDDPIKTIHLKRFKKDSALTDRIKKLVSHYS